VTEAPGRFAEDPIFIPIRMLLTHASLNDGSSGFPDAERLNQPLGRGLFAQHTHDFGIEDFNHGRLLFHVVHRRISGNLKHARPLGERDNAPAVERQV
jgi:hypothetical protein